MSVPAALMQETTRADLDATWFEREQEAQTLLVAGYRSMAVSLRLYALEIRIKSIVCRQLKLDNLPKACKTHDLTELVIFTGLWKDLNEPVNDLIKQNWNLLAEFSKRRLNDIRYSPRETLTDTESDRLFLAFDDPIDGVLIWLSRHP